MALVCYLRLVFLLFLVCQMLRAVSRPSTRVDPHAVWSITSIWIPPSPPLLSAVHFCFFFQAFDEACGVCLAGLSFRLGASKLGFDICVVTVGTSGAVNFDVDSSSLFFNAYFNFRVSFCMGWNASFRFFQVFCRSFRTLLGLLKRFLFSAVLQS